MRTRKVAILLYDEAEVLDFAGPFEVFSVTSELNGFTPFTVFTVAPENAVVRAVNGLRVVPDYSLDQCPRPDILVISGGSGSRKLLESERVVQWVGDMCSSAEVILSICSGARILAKAGLLRGLRVTTHHEVIDHLRELEPTASVVRDKRFVDTGRIVTTGGISAGIDGSFHVVERLLGEDVARRTAAYMEYDWCYTDASRNKSSG